jgi:ribosomal protein S18 acetylase RimI-like enzyme
MPTVVELKPSRVDELRDLWLQLHHHHQAVSPVGPFIDDDASWSLRLQGYLEILADGGFVLVAQQDAQIVGYALVRIHEGRDDSWELGDRHGEVWTLVVDERHRGQGIGGALLDEVDARLERLGIRSLMIGLMVGNEGARRLYESRGLTAGWLQLYRTEG